MFIKHGSNTIVVLLVYVDDIVLSGNDLSKIQRITHLLDSAFKIKDLGDLRYFLGFEVARSSTGINLCQRKDPLEILNDAGMLGSKPMSTPCNYTTKLHQHSGSPLSAEDASSYRRLIGRLINLTNTRPNITYCHTLISSGNLCSMTCDHSLVLVRCLAPIIRQFVKFQDMPENRKNIDAQSVSFRDTPEIKRKHRCIIK